ncbi:MAG: hypothetical protein QOF58_5640 [Pseudonocardiales bacterium]|jgi:hypothetical protein|nr:hypothetical protein [Pseudonocardiales bacterium]
MSWINQDGKHEGWVARVLDDGREATGSTGRSCDGGGVEYFEIVPVADDPQRDDLVPSDRVHWWATRCTCGWQGSTWERVTELHQASDAERRAWLPLGDVGDAPEHVADAAHAEWLGHAAPYDAATAVRRAAEDVTLYQRRLDAAVLDARQRGLSWESIGAAAGIGSDAARERWGPPVAHRQRDS